MSFPVRRLAADPAGRGPIATCARRSLKARSALNGVPVGASSWALPQPATQAIAVATAEMTRALRVEGRRTGD
jgi:hypothetical protein